jgi:hypothetical protein
MATLPELIGTFEAQIKALQETAKLLPNSEDIDALTRIFEQQIKALVDKPSAIDKALESMHETTFYSMHHITGELGTPKWKSFTHRVKSILHSDDVFTTLQENSHEWGVTVGAAAIDVLFPRY